MALEIIIKRKPQLQCVLYHSGTKRLRGDRKLSIIYNTNTAAATDLAMSLPCAV